MKNPTMILIIVIAIVLIASIIIFFYLRKKERERQALQQQTASGTSGNVIQNALSLWNTISGLFGSSTTNTTSPTEVQGAGGEVALRTATNYLEVK